MYLYREKLCPHYDEKEIGVINYRNGTKYLTNTISTVKRGRYFEAGLEPNASVSNNISSVLYGKFYCVSENFILEASLTVVDLMMRNFQNFINGTYYKTELLHRYILQ